MGKSRRGSPLRCDKACKTTFFLPDAHVSSSVGWGQKTCFMAGCEVAAARHVHHEESIALRSPTKSLRDLDPPCRQIQFDGVEGGAGN